MTVCCLVALVANQSNWLISQAERKKGENGEKSSKRKRYSLQQEENLDVNSTVWEQCERETKLVHYKAALIHYARA